ncbi:hypothetical protein BU17DRAFT_93613 [Hysterangium stoloniferum]|nr:hypothetical protein BU17DRAFT_93613 [Hysterangium stoloniferum]
MSPAEDGDMDWQPFSIYHPPQSHITALPFDIFLELVKRVDIWDFLQLRRTCRTLYSFSSASAVWTIFAEAVIERRPIPLPPFRARASLSPAELQTAILRAIRLERNWLSDFGRLRAPPKVLREPTRAQGDLLVLLPGGKHLVTGATSRRAGTNGCIRVWDLTSGDCLASFVVRPEDDVFQWRPVDEGRGVMFLVRDGVLSEDSGPQHFHLLRLEFTESLYPTQATFFHHSSFVQELSIADTSLSEDVVIILGIDIDNTITMFILHWRDGTMVSIKTPITPPVHPYFAILSLNAVSIWVDSPVTPHTFSYPLSEIFPHFSYPPKPPIVLGEPRLTVLNHVANITPSPPLGFVQAYRDTTRKWVTGPNSSLLGRPLSILHVATQTGSDPVLTSLSHEYLPTDFSPAPTDRTYFAPLPIFAARIAEDQPLFPVVAAEAGTLIFAMLNSNGVYEMKVMMLPPDDPAERRHEPQWYNDRLIKSLEVPPEMDLTKMAMMSMSDDTGVLAIAMENGDIFILEY